MELRCKVKPNAMLLKLAEAFDYDFNGEIVTQISDLPNLPEDFSIVLFALTTDFLTVDFFTFLPFPPPRFLV